MELGSVTLKINTQHTRRTLCSRRWRAGFQSDRRGVLCGPLYSRTRPSVNLVQRALCACLLSSLISKVRSVCVFYYCRTYYKAVRVGGGGEWRTCAMRDDEPRPVWMSLPITH
jgi:hypothetical protein